MTKNKRFIIKPYGDTFNKVIIDELDQYRFPPLQHDFSNVRFRNALNGLWEHNQELTEENEELKQKYDIIAEENRQLKEEYTKLKHYHSNLHDDCIDLETENNRLQNDVEFLEKENKGLKSKVNDTQVAVEIATEECMQRVFQLIDKNIREVKEIFEEGRIDLNSYNSTMITLTGLKEELQS